MSRPRADPLYEEVPSRSVDEVQRRSPDRERIRSFGLGQLGASWRIGDRPHSRWHRKLDDNVVGLVGLGPSQPALIVLILVRINKLPRERPCRPDDACDGESGR